MFARARVCIQKFNDVFPGRDGETCLKDGDCSIGHRCLNGTCTCPPDMHRVISDVRHYDQYIGSVVKNRRSKCLSPTGTFSFANLDVK